MSKLSPTQEDARDAIAHLTDAARGLAGTLAFENVSGLDVTIKTIRDNISIATRLVERLEEAGRG